MGIEFSGSLIMTLAIAALVGIAVLVAAFAVFGNAFSSEARMQRRIDSLAGKGEPTAKGRANRDREKDRRKVLQDTLKDLEEKQKERRARMTLRRRITQAGFTFSPTSFYIASAGFGLVIGIVAMLFSGKPWVGALAAFAAGAGVPRWGLGFMAARRLKQFATEFANALDVIVRGVKSGLPLNECLQIIANESPEPIKSEFQTLVDALKMGVSLEQALGRMHDNVPVAEVSFFSIVLAIQQKSGGNLSEALGNLASVLRSRKSMRGKIEAMSGEAKASAMIIGALPPGVMILVYLSTPAYIALLWTTQMGQLMLIGCAVWMTLGIVVMNKMINFRF
jgi:tight adherence protein B